jgi:hypothetical protein
MRSRRPPETLDLGDGATADGVRLICGLGADRNEGVRAGLLGLIVGGCDLIACGDGCALGAWFLAEGREPPAPSRPRNCPQAGPAVKTTAKTAITPTEPRTRLFAFQTPTIREQIVSLKAYIEILLSPRRQHHRRASTPLPGQPPASDTPNRVVWDDSIDSTQGSPVTLLLSTP